MYSAFYWKTRYWSLGDGNCMRTDKNIVLSTVLVVTVRREPWSSSDYRSNNVASVFADAEAVTIQEQYRGLPSHEA